MGIEGEVVDVGKVFVVVQIQIHVCFIRCAFRLSQRATHQACKRGLGGIRMRAKRVHMDTHAVALLRISQIIQTRPSKVFDFESLVL